MAQMTTLRISKRRADTAAIGILEIRAEEVTQPDEPIPAKHRRKRLPKIVHAERPDPSSPSLSDETLEALRAHFDAEGWNAEDEIDVCQAQDKVDQA